MTTTELLALLRDLGVRLHSDGERLRLQDPGLVLTDELRTELVARKGELLAFLRDAEVATSAGADVITRAPRTGAQPASSGQRRLWFLEQLHPGTCAYNIPAAFRLRGRLDAETLRQSFEALVTRHEALRTTFASHDGEPAQRVVSPTPFELAVEAVAADALYPTSLEEARRPFDLERGPLLRARLLRLAEDEHVLLITVHHIVFDGWSMGILTRELGALYNALRSGTTAHLPELPIQYADYAAWQRRRLDSEATGKDVAYWADQLTPLPPTLELPTTYPRPAVQSFRGENRARPFPRDLEGRLHALARSEGSSAFMVLLAAYAVLLHRYTGQDDLAIGTPVAGRGRPGTEGLLGFFVNMLVLRVRIEEGMTFRSLLRHVRDIALDAFARQDIPFERLVEDLHPDRSLGRSPLVQTMFVYQNAPAAPLALDGVVAAPADFFGGTAKLDLSLFAEEGPEGPRLVGEYNTEIFDAETIDRLLGHYELLLRTALSDPEQVVARLPLLTPGEQSRLAALSRGPARGLADGYDPDATLVALLAAQAARTPDAVAASFEGASLTYSDLAARADALAHSLAVAGVGRSAVVAVALERSLALPVALLAVLKAGAAYLPLDAAYPAARLSVVLADAEPAAVIVSARSPAVRGLAEVLVEYDGAVVAVDAEGHPREGPLDRGGSPERALPEVGPGDAAYVIYTSGSTGRPKGVVVEHGAICNRLAWHQEAFALAPGEGVLQKTPVTFDVSVWEVFWPLAYGGRLVLARPEGHRDPAYLASVVASEEVAVCHFVPSMLRAFLASVGQAALRACTSLRAVICSGEALAPDVVASFYAAGLAGVGLHNLYGPTEAAVDVTHWACPPTVESSMAEPPSVVPIGRPISNVRCYVVDGAGGLCPQGVWGELWLGGVQVARGYLGREQLTADRFLTDPFSGEPGGRVYRTGDVVRWGAGGALEYRGRSDHQVKVRGFRIELGEVEAALGVEAGVASCAVVARGEGPERRLVAYVVLDSNAALDTSALRVALSRTLPDYMVPTTIVFLDALPLTSSGKLDRNALPEPDAPHSTEPFVSPTSEAERAIAAVWQECLRLDRIGLDDSFFDLGGHSLLAVQVQGRLRQALGREVSLLDLFTYPTVRALARSLAENGETSEAALQAAVARATRQRKALHARRVDPSMLT